MIRTKYYEPVSYHELGDGLHDDRLPDQIKETEMLKINKLQTLGMIVLILAALFVTISAIKPAAVPGDELDSATRSYIARGEAMIAKRQAGLDLSLPPRPDFSHLNDKAMIPVTGSSEGLAAYHSGGWGGPVAVQNGLVIYHQSERNAAQGSAFHYGPPGR
jgi:hypothetical protein